MAKKQELAKAKKLWETFNDKKPRRLISVKLNPWPEAWGLSGEATRVYYLSDKWSQDGKYTAYYHDHEGGVALWEPYGAQKWLVGDSEAPVRGLPFRNGVVLGYCLGWVMRRERDDVEMEVEFAEGAVLLCAEPNGKTLFAIAVKDENVLALFCGGDLDVRAEGIVG